MHGLQWTYLGCFLTSQTCLASSTLFIPQDQPNQQLLLFCFSLDSPPFLPSLENHSLYSLWNPKQPGESPFCRRAPSFFAILLSLKTSPLESKISPGRSEPESSFLPFFVASVQIFPLQAWTESLASKIQYTQILTYQWWFQLLEKIPVMIDWPKPSPSFKLVE